MSILSCAPDGLGYYYGYFAMDPRQIKVRDELEGWRAYVGGVALKDVFSSKSEAELMAMKYVQANPMES